MGKKKETVETPESSPEAPAVLEQTERDAMYANFEESQSQPVPEDTGSSPEEEELGTKEEESEQSPEEDTEHAPEEAEGEDKEDTEEKPGDKEERTVPYGALKEERTKRQALQGQVTELESQVRTLIEDNKTFMEQGKKAETDQSNLESLLEDGDFDGALKESLKETTELKKRFDRLEKHDQERTDGDKVKEQSRTNERIENRIKTIDSELEKEGFPGFDMFVDKMNAELDRMIQDDSDNVSLNNDEGFKKIYKENVYPKIKSLFVKQDREDTMDSKRKLKEKANLGKGGRGNALEGGKKNDKDLTTKEMYTDYVKMRGDLSPS